MPPTTAWPCIYLKSWWPHEEPTSLITSSDCLEEYKTMEKLGLDALQLDCLNSFLTEEE